MFVIAVERGNMKKLQLIVWSLAFLALAFSGCKTNPPIQQTTGTAEIQNTKEVNTVQNEIMNLIDSNRELFGEMTWNDQYNQYDVPEYGSFELYVENEGEEKYYYLIERNSSIIFFRKLLEFIKTQGNYRGLISELEKTIIRIGIK